MAIRFRKTIKVAPGIKLNLGKTGISTTVGKKGLSVNMSKRGTYLNTGIPGTGLSSRTKMTPSNRNSTNANKGCIVVALLLLLPVSIIGGVLYYIS